MRFWDNSTHKKLPRFCGRANVLPVRRGSCYHLAQQEGFENCAASCSVVDGFFLPGACSTAYYIYYIYQNLIICASFRSLRSGYRIDIDFSNLTSAHEAMQNKQFLLLRFGSPQLCSLNRLSWPLAIRLACFFRRLMPILSLFRHRTSGQYNEHLETGTSNSKLWNGARGRTFTIAYNRIQQFKMSEEELMEYHIGET